ncbi:periplasmic oligopeptide-binding protein [Verrucomicrobiota bacterium]|nr:periplasmic oligopeptide-binding protein [Verrucomicrobiota bacterium]
MRCPSRSLSLALVAALVALVGCKPKEDTAAQMAKAGILVINNNAEPSGLDPQEVTGLLESRIVYSLFEGLVNYDPVDLHPIPGVAESWTMAPMARPGPLNFGPTPAGPPATP